MFFLFVWNELLSREVSIDEATAFAKQNNAVYEEVSAKEGFNVRKLFMDITNDVLNKILHNEIDFNNEVKNESYDMHRIPAFIEYP